MHLITKDSLYLFEFPGSEFLSGKNVGDFFLRLDYVEPSFRFDLKKGLVPEKIYRLVNSIDSGLSSASGTLTDDFFLLHDGFHRYLFLYSVFGFDGFLPIRGITGACNVKKLNSDSLISIGSSLNNILRKNPYEFGLIECCLHGLIDSGKLSSVYLPSFNSFKRSLF